MSALCNNNTDDSINFLKNDQVFYIKMEYIHFWIGKLVKSAENVSLYLKETNLFTVLSIII